MQNGATWTGRDAEALLRRVQNPKLPPFPRLWRERHTLSQHRIGPSALAAEGPVSPAHFPPPPPASVGALGTASGHRGHQACLFSWGASEVPRKDRMSRKQVLRQVETPRTFGGLSAPRWQHNPWQRAAQSGRLLLPSRLGLLGGASVECNVFSLVPGAHDSRRPTSPPS